MKTRSNLKPKFGIVAMLDALGLRNATIAESVYFIKTVRDIVRNFPETVDARYGVDDQKKIEKVKNVPPQLTAFGDTIIFSWEMNPEGVGDFLPDVGYFLVEIIISGLKNKLAFRGAISVGDYIQSGAIVLGPVITDLAAWYDSAEMIGVFATPHCSHFLSCIHETKPIDPELDFVQYDVPLKGNLSRRLWTVPWPKAIEFWMANQTELHTYYTLIQKFSVPKGTEDKFYNTEKFVKWMLPPKPETERTTGE